MMALFLDTATQFARHWHADSEREELRRQLGGRNLYCSRYVECQYKAVLLNSAIALFNLLKRFKDLKRALRESTCYQNADIAGLRLSRGVQTRIAQIAGWMLEFCDHDEQAQRLEDLIEDVWETQFYQGLERPLIDKTGCVYAKETPEVGESGAYNPVRVSCTLKDPPVCGIRSFWEDHSAYLELLCEMTPESIKAEPKDVNELEKVKTSAQEVRKGKAPCGNRCTVYLSDGIICLESTHCPEDAAMHSINKKHFRPLCEILGIEPEPRD